MKSVAANSRAPCKVALLGCGAVSELFYSPALQHLEAEKAARLVAIYDKDAQHAAEFQKIFPDATVYPDESFLQAGALDLAIVATPVSFHADSTIRALEAGIAVLCEKPIATNTQEADRMIQAAQKNQRILAVGLLRRFYSNVHFVRQLIENKTLGVVKTFSIHEGGPFNWPARSDSFFRKKIAGGGVLLDIGVHVLDLVIHWFGEPEELFYSDDAMGGVEANCRIGLSYKNFKGDIRLSRDWETSNRYVIEFERGTLKLRAGDGGRLEMQLEDSNFSLEAVVKEQAGVTSSFNRIVSAHTLQQAFLMQLKDLIFAIQTGCPPAIPGEEGIRSLRLIEQCYQKRTLMQMPWLTPEELKYDPVPIAREAS